MSTETHTEDLSELDAEAVVAKVKELLDDGWTPTTLELQKEESETTEDPVLR